MLIRCFDPEKVFVCTKLDVFNGDLTNVSAMYYSQHFGEGKKKPLEAWTCGCAVTLATIYVSKIDIRSLQVHVNAPL